MRSFNFIHKKTGGTKMNVTTVGIDIAKHVFELHGVDSKGKTVLKKTIRRDKLPEFMANLPACLVGLEACGGSHHWARKFKQMGHEIKLMNPQFVKPYVKSNKNDSHDAAAICEAVQRPSMRFVGVKTIEQQDIQAVHRIRARLVNERTALVNQIRGLLAEYGIVVAQGIQQLRKKLPVILEDAGNELSNYGRELMSDLLAQFYNVDAKVDEYDERIKKICKENEICQRLIQIKGVRCLTATAIIASIGDASVFKNGREMAAFLGLVPKQHSSGGKSVLLGISKRGDCYLRYLLVHGARAVVTRAKNLPPKRAAWIQALIGRRGRNRAIVALANKNARAIWTLMMSDKEYKVA
jgi:transposase